MRLLSISNLSKKFDKKLVLDNIDLTLKKGVIVGLCGKNGAGKTTLIKLINGLLIPDTGTIKVKGEDIGVESKKIISYLPDRIYFNKKYNLKHIIEYFKDFYSDFNEERALSLFKELDLDIDMKFYKMSKGMQEKALLALVLSRNADIYILDEPIGGVDPATREYILDKILNNFKEDATILISTHLISDVEKILDEVIFIDKGKIVLHDECDKLRSEKNMSIDELFRSMFKC